MTSRCRSPRQQYFFFHSCSSNSLLEEFIISTPVMIFGYGPVHAQHDSHSISLHPALRDLGGLAHIVWDSNGKERKVQEKFQEPVAFIIVVLKIKFSEIFWWRAALSSSYRWIKSLFKQDTSHFYDHLWPSLCCFCCIIQSKTKDR